MIGLAYVDQLVREDALSADMTEDLSDVLTRARGPVEAGESDSDLSRELRSLADDLAGSESDPATAERLTALRGVMSDLAEALL